MFVDEAQLLYFSVLVWTPNWLWAPTMTVQFFFHPIRLFYPRDIPIPVLSNTHILRAGVAVAGVLVRETQRVSPPRVVVEAP